MKKKFKVATLGCRTNQYESQAYADQLVQLGYVPAGEGEVVDVCIVNTCTVTASADRSSRHLIRSLARENPGAKIIVTGCMAEKSQSEVSALEGVTLVVPNKEKEKLLCHLHPSEEIPEFAIRKFEGHTRAFVKVQDGCNCFCSYCIVPFVRGRSRSRRVEEILKEVKALLLSGYKEIVLTGVNVGDFDGGGEESLSSLVKKLDHLEELKRLRISSIDPTDVDEELISALAQGRSTCPSMHLVLQSGSGTILKRMNRKSTPELFLKVVERLRRERPSFTFTTDVIVGFPGESEQDFEATVEMVKRVHFAKVHIFPYSAREGTRAFSFPERVPHEVIEKRRARLSVLCDSLALSLRDKEVGAKREVLFESAPSGKEGWLSGHTEEFFPVLVKTQEARAGEMRVVKLIENTKEALIGRI